MRGTAPHMGDRASHHSYVRDPCVSAQPQFPAGGHYDPAARPLPGAEESKWRDMFSMALSQTTQLMEQTELLKKEIPKHDGSDQARKIIEEVLHSIEIAQYEVERLSISIVRAAGLKSRRTGNLEG